MSLEVTKLFAVPPTQLDASLSGVPKSTASYGLLPTPSSDPIAALYQLAAQVQETEAASARQDVTTAFARKERAERELAAALERARKAKEEEPGIFDSLGIASLVGVAASAPLVVVADVGMHMARLTPDALERFERTHASEIELAAKALSASAHGVALATGGIGGGAAERALVALGGLLLQETGVLGPEASDYLGSGALVATASGSASGIAGRTNALAILADKDSETAERIRDVDDATKVYTKHAAVAGMLLAGAATIVASWGTAAMPVVAVGIALSASSFAVSETRAAGETWTPWLSAGLGAAGALVTGFAAPANTLAVIGRVASGSAEMRDGAAQVQAAGTSRVVGHAEVDAEGARHEMRRIDRLLEDVIDAVRESGAAFQRIAKGVAHAIEVRNETALVAVASLKG